MSTTLCSSVEEMRKTCARHQDLREQFNACLHDLKQNEAQLEILRETAVQLEERHTGIRRLLESAPTEESLQLEQEIDGVGRQVRVWMTELHEVHDRRVEIDCRLLRLNSELKKNATCVKLANIDAELLQSRHERRWKSFLQDTKLSSSKLSS
ncbi:unnamed protein product [Caenorhabditis auriculariae]|uniref:Uncharacterized protein n=1 Tax=Caenorhabditis auriculariae TaxID=2777116 RepID=A0A8S1GYQ6_9PELO|nr:unnamed protein product [Caenorhabditis auriculariae]